MNNGSASPPDAAALAQLAREGRLKEMTAALAAGASADTVDRHGASLLMPAATYGNVTLIELLLQHGANVHYIDKKGRTALGAALYRGQAGSVEMLLRAGANPDAGRPSARELAARWQKSDLLQ